MNKLLILSLFIIFSSCKQTEEGKETEKEPEKELTIAEKIAYAHGYEHWNNVKTFEFKFGGTLEDSTSGRSWVWNPKTSDVKMTRNGETTEYNRNSMDSVAINADKAFINDKFWALIPFQLVWDDVEYFSEPLVAAPVSKVLMNKITIIYPNEGGYTPGDAYDIYFDKDYIIREWSYRRGNAPEPSLSNTFENYSDYNGIKVAQEHKFAGSDRNLLVRNVKVTLE